jgi:hypothetical protein
MEFRIKGTTTKEFKEVELIENDKYLDLEIDGDNVISLSTDGSGVLINRNKLEKFGFNYFDTE